MTFTITQDLGSRRRTSRGATTLQLQLAAAALALGVGMPVAEAQVAMPFEFGVAQNGDLFAIKKRDTGSKSTEVHVLSAASGYERFSLQTGSALHETDATFSFAVAANRDVFAFKRSKTGSGSTEVHVLSAASNYRQFSLQTGTALHETDGTWSFAVAPNRDVFAFKRTKTGSHSTEVHVLSAESGYKSFSLQTGTALHETDASFSFAVASNRDVVVISQRNTGSHSTEVHVLAAASNYQTFSLQTGTALQETDDTFAFAVAENRNLVAVKTRKTGSKSTEVHVLAAASNYQSFSLQTGTALHELTAQTFPDGVFVKASGAAIYLVEAGQLRALPDWGTYLAMGVTTQKVKIAPDAMVDAAPKGANLPTLRNGNLLKGNDATIYLLEGSKLRAIPDLETFNAKGWSLDRVLSVGDGVVAAIPRGAPLKSVKA